MQCTQEIPCVECKSWDEKQKKFACNPKKCEAISAWLLVNVPQLSNETLQMQMRLPEVAIQYVV